jgi:hypothetical protein
MKGGNEKGANCEIRKRKEEGTLSFLTRNIDPCSKIKRK